MEMFRTRASLLSPAKITCRLVMFEIREYFLGIRHFGSNHMGVLLFSHDERRQGFSLSDMIDREAIWSHRSFTRPPAM